MQRLAHKSYVEGVVGRSGGRNPVELAGKSDGESEGRVLNKFLGVLYEVVVWSRTKDGVRLRVDALREGEGTTVILLDGVSRLKSELVRLHSRCRIEEAE